MKCAASSNPPDSPDSEIVPGSKAARPLFGSVADYETFRERFAKAVKEREAAYALCRKVTADRSSIRKHVT
jgi:hypothetical protein